MRYRGEVRAIRLHQNLGGLQHSGRLTKFTGIFKSYNAGKGNQKSDSRSCESLLTCACKAMEQSPASRPGVLLAQNIHQIRPCIPAMQGYGEAPALRDTQLPPQDIPLHFPWR